MPTPYAMPDFQPLMRLAQKNFALYARFSLSPEVMAQTAAAAQAVAERAPASAARIAGSPAWSELLQGLARNYMEFMAEMGQGFAAALAGASTRAAGAAAETIENNTAAAAGAAARR